jgi:hypothetical protein
MWLILLAAHFLLVSVYLLVASMAHCLSLKMEAIHSFEMSGNFY